MKKMHIKPPFTQHVSLILAFTLLSVSLAACAPTPEMAATLTLLPGTFTPLPATPWPTPTHGATPTFVLTRDTPSADGTLLPGETPAPVNAQTPAPKAQSGAACSISYDTTVPSTNAPASFRGRHFDMLHLPAGLQLLGSGLLESNEYSWNHLRWENRDLYLVEKLVCRDSLGKAYWEIVDALLLPTLNSQAHEVTTDMCFQGDQAVPFVVAYGSYDPSKPAVTVASNFSGAQLKVKQAWQMTDHFAALDPAKLTCIYQDTQGAK